MSAEASPVRFAVAGLVAISALALVIPAWRWTSADRLVDMAPDRALARVPQHPGALAKEAALAFEAGDDLRAEEMAKAAIASRPLEARPYRILAAVYERSGRLPEAHAAQQAAIAVAPSDAVARLWLASRLLAESRFGESLNHIDRALRARPDLADSVFPILAGGLDNEDFAAALVEALERQPPWRRLFLGHVAANSEQVAQVRFLFEALARQGPLTPEEVRLLIARLERDQRWDDLRAAWDETVDPGSGLGAGLVDGGFEREPHGFGLGWRVSRVPGAIIGFTPARGSDDGGRALSLRFFDQRVPFSHVQQLLLLSEGNYRLSGEARLDGLRARRGLRWEVSCHGRGEPIARSPSLLGTSSWKRWEVEFDVAEGCVAQWLVLGLEAIGPSEQLIGGGIAFDGLRIERLAVGSTDHTTGSP
jgi:tetratricopeptide (TPR) repeat protein